MLYTSKLDFLAEMAKQWQEDPGKSYLIGLLAEHADEEDCDEEFLNLVKEMLK